MGDPIKNYVAWINRDKIILEKLLKEQAELDSAFRTLIKSSAFTKPGTKPKDIEALGFGVSIYEQNLQLKRENLRVQINAVNANLRGYQSRINKILRQREATKMRKKWREEQRIKIKYGSQEDRAFYKRQALREAKRKGIEPEQPAQE